MKTARINILTPHLLEVILNRERVRGVAEEEKGGDNSSKSHHLATNMSPVLPVTWKIPNFFRVSFGWCLMARSGGECGVRDWAQRCSN